jgi:hypothetical protein
MANFAETLLFSAIMGFSIYLSLPVILHRKRDEVTTRLLVAIATTCSVGVYYSHGYPGIR